MKNIYIGNVSHQASEQQVRQLFEQYGKVNSVRLMTDKITNKPRGFGFIVMADDAEAQNAINALNDTDFMGRPLKVNEARPQQPRTQSSYNSRPRNNYNNNRY